MQNIAIKKQKFSRWLYLEKKSKGLTFQQIANFADVNPGFIHDIISGRRTASLTVAKKICSNLGNKNIEDFNIIINENLVRVP